MPEITETKLKEQIAKEQIGSLYFLYGDEKLLVRRNLNRLLKNWTAISRNSTFRNSRTTRP